MEYQKIANLLDDASNQPSKFKTKNWAEINGESRGTYNVNSQIKFKTTMRKSSLCDYSDSYILVKRKITVTGAGDNAETRPANERDKGVAFKNCAPFTNCISEINNTQIEHLEVYGNFTEMKQMKIQQILNHLNLKFEITDRKLYVRVVT